MTFLEKLRKRWEAKRREHGEKEAEELAAEARGETYMTHGHKDALTPPRGHDPPPREWPPEP